MESPGFGLDAISIEIVEGEPDGPVTVVLLKLEFNAGELKAERRAVLTERYGGT